MSWMIIRRNVEGCSIWEAEKDGLPIFAATTNLSDRTPVTPSGCQYFYCLNLALRSVWWSQSPEIKITGERHDQI